MWEEQKRAGSYAKHLEVPMVLGHKTREKEQM